jgi:hypothetical protein
MPMKPSKSSRSLRGVLAFTKNLELKILAQVYCTKAIVPGKAPPRAGFFITFGTFGG